jgi:hypothetical protein
LISSSLDATFLAVAFMASWWLELPALTAVALFSAGSTAAYLVYYALAWWAARTAATFAESLPAERPQETTDLFS